MLTESINHEKNKWYLKGTHRGLNLKTSCRKCLNPVSLPGITVDENHYHSLCFVCAVCSIPLEACPDFRIRQGKIYCNQHAGTVSKKVCDGCNEIIETHLINVAHRNYHESCCRCKVCNINLKEHDWLIVNGDLLCQNDAGQLK